MTTLLSTLRRTGLGILVVLTVLVLPATAGADARADRAEVQRKQAKVASELNALRATDAQVERALAVLEANVRTQTAALRNAERRVAEAESALAEATSRVEAKQAEIATLDTAVKEFAVEALIRPPGSDDLVEALESSTIGEAELRRSLMEAKSAAQIDALDQLERAREDLDIARQDAAAAASAAAEHRAEAAEALDYVSEARDQQAALAASLSERVEHKLYEQANLAALERQLSQQISASRGPVNIVGSGDIVSVRGIQVHRSIADEVAGLLRAADGDGIYLSGGGYRSNSRQVELRRAHCGSSNYDIYEKPASQCRPPTAQPGQSMHERGLAIDFTHNGRAISSRSSPAFQWLKSNAASYGLYNLPSEPWHWSVNGN